MSHRFRELETTLPQRKKDVVLLATVTSFEGMERPAKSELQQFAELFVPLYQQSGEDARRKAVAALSQCKVLPPVVSAFVASQPIAIAAPFLKSCPALSDDLLIAIARTQGADHARAIAARDNLSVRVVDLLVSLRDDRQPQPDAPRDAPVTITAPPLSPDIADLGVKRENVRLLAEESLRAELKRRVLFSGPTAAEIAEEQERRDALLVRFARERAAHSFAVVLADALNASLWLSRRIMLDVSGEQLATTLVALAMPPADAAFCLNRLYPHLSLAAAADILARHPVETSAERIAAWVRADAYTTGEAGKRMPPVAENGNATTGQVPAVAKKPLRFAR